MAADANKILFANSDGFFPEMRRATKKAVRPANRAIQPPRLRVMNMPVPHKTKELAAPDCSFFLSDVMMSPMVIMKSAERNAAKIFGSVIIPQHLVLNSSLEAGSSHVAGMGGASMYSAIANNPWKKPVKAAAL